MKFVTRMLTLAIMATPVFADMSADQVTIPGFSLTPEKPAAKEIIVVPQTQLQAPARTTTTTVVVKTQKPSAEIAAAWLNFVNNLRSCSVGTFRLKQINPELRMQYGEDVTIKILGPDTDDTCLANIMYFQENDPRLAPNPSLSFENKIIKLPAGQECVFSKASSEAYIAIIADLVNGKDIEDTADDPNYKAMDEDCSPYVMINGQKTGTMDQEQLPILE